MKLAIGNQMIGPDLTWDQRVAAAAEAGYDGVEIWLGTPDLEMKSTDGEIEALRAVLDRAGLSCSSVASTLGWKHPITDPDDEVFARALAIGRRQIEAARILGTDGILVVTGRVLPEVPFRQAWDRMVDGFRQLGDYAAERGVRVGAETCPKLSKNLMTPGECRTFLDEVDCPAVGIYVDTANVTYSGYPADFVRELGSDVVRIHGKDWLPADAQGRERATWPGNGMIDWAPVTAACAETGYDGWVALEFPPPPGEARTPELVRRAAESARALGLS